MTLYEKYLEYKKQAEESDRMVCTDVNFFFETNIAFIFDNDNHWERYNLDEVIGREKEFVPYEGN